MADIDLKNTDAQDSPLLKALRQCEHIKATVLETAGNLKQVAVAIDRQLESRGSQAFDSGSVETSRGIQVKLGQASESLSDVIRALESEVRERDTLSLQFAAAIEQEEAARRASLHDALTGMPNRALFNDRLEHGLAQARRHGWTLALMFMDLDDFKGINDRYGHDVGDVVLQTIARRLQDNTRGDDSVSRHGGDEFLYLAVDTQNEANISLLVGKIIQVIQEPVHITGPDFEASLIVTASIGISIFPKHGTEADMLLKSADAAMYIAKRQKLGFSFPA